MTLPTREECECPCHTTPGMRHITACCVPNTTSCPTRATFTHLMDDDLSDTLFMYFESGTVQDLAGKEYEMEEFCVWLKRDQYKKMRQYFLDNPELS